ncbi:MAG: hypothetical protein Q8S41_14230, partial [Lutibacter sp.]|nr:hypothetical protein [Lutibacter sp.]
MSSKKSHLLNIAYLSIHCCPVKIHCNLTILILIGLNKQVAPMGLVFLKIYFLQTVRPSGTK